MKLEKLLVVLVVALLVCGLAAVPDALARGGKGGGKGKGKGKKGKDGRVMDRKTLVQELENDARTADQNERHTSGRRADFDAVHRENREDVMGANRRAGEDARRSADARLEAPR